jgi:hypothetical protein
LFDMLYAERSCGGQAMTSIMDLSEADGASFVAQFEAALPIIGYCSAANFEQIVQAYKLKASSPTEASTYIKFHHYALVSATVDTLGVLAANEFEIEKDEKFRAVLDDVKANFALSSFNNVFRSFPYAPMHGQDIMLFRALELESLKGGISFFDYREIRVALGEKIINVLACDAESHEYELQRDNLVRYYGELFSSRNRLAEVDLSFGSIATKGDGFDARTFISDFERFMKSIPANVYHCHGGNTVYSNRGFLLPCDCGQSHLIDRCEAICDGGSAHFAVFRSLCGKTISKVVTEGVFRVKGIKVVSKVTASVQLIDIVEQAVASRKRIE